MSRIALALVFPAAAVLLVCSLVVLFLTATGLEPGPLVVESTPEEVGGTVADSTVLAWCGTQAADQQRSVSLSPEEAAGDALFKGNCAQCHAINDVVVGPALAGIDKRRPLPWILKWVKNSSKVVASGDEYAVKLFNQYQQQQMPSFDLTDKEIESIVQYLRGQESAPTVMPTVAIVD